MHGLGASCAGFFTIKDLWQTTSNPTNVRRPGLLESGRRHTCLVEVRGNLLRASVDGKVVKEWKPDWEGLKLPDFLELSDGAALGFASYKSPTIVHRIEVREVSGRGRVTR